jgi:hypothetical protein
LSRGKTLLFPYFKNVREDFPKVFPELKFDEKSLAFYFRFLDGFVQKILLKTVSQEQQILYAINAKKNYVKFYFFYNLMKF